MKSKNDRLLLVGVIAPNIFGTIDDSAGVIMKIAFTAYNLIECGYGYRKKKGVPVASPGFYSIENLTEDLVRWLDGKDLSATKLKYRKFEKDIYCSEIIKSNSNIFLALWVGADLIHGNRQLSIDPQSKVNSPSVSSKNVDGKIPGFPSFFMISPNNIIVSLRPENYPSSAVSIDNYFYNFLRHKSPRLVFDDDTDEEIRILGYRNDVGEIVKAIPRFYKVFASKKEYIDYLRKRRGSISKVMYRGDIPTTIKKKSVAAKLLAGLFGGIGLSYDHGQINTDIPIAYELDYPPDDREFNLILEQYKNLSGDSDDIGFKFKKDSQNYWLSRALVKDEFDIKADFDDTGNILLSSFVGEVTKLIDGFLKGVQAP